MVIMKNAINNSAAQLFRIKNLLYKSLMIFFILIVSYGCLQPPKAQAFLPAIFPIGIEIAGAIYAGAVALLSGTTAVDYTKPENVKFIGDMTSRMNRLIVGDLIKSEFSRAMQMARDGGTMIHSFNMDLSSMYQTDTSMKNTLTRMYTASIPKNNIEEKDYSQYVWRAFECGGCLYDYKVQTFQGVGDFYTDDSLFMFQSIELYSTGQIYGYNKLGGYELVGSFPTDSSFRYDDINSIMAANPQIKLTDVRASYTPPISFDKAWITTGGNTTMAMPPLTAYTAKSTATGEKLDYNWDTGTYSKKGVPTTEPVTWVPPTPKVVVNPVTKAIEVGVDVPIGGKDVFVPSKEIGNTHNPYIPQTIPLQDFAVSNIPVGGIDVYYPDTPYFDMDFVFTPSNATNKALDIVVSPPIATVDPVTGRITATAQGDAIIRISNPAIPKTLNIPISITGVPTTNPPISNDWPNKLKVAVTTRFPFSLPWDMAYLVNMFVAPPQIPVIDVHAGPIKFKVTLNQIDPYMPFIRAFLIAGFLFGLIFKTRSLLGGGK